MELFCLNDRLPILQGGTFGLLAPTMSLLSMPQWVCPAWTQNATLVNISSPEFIQVWQSRIQVVSVTVELERLVKTDIFGKEIGATGISFVALTDPGFHHGGLPVPGAGGILWSYWSVYAVHWSSDNCTHHLSYWPLFVWLCWHECRKPLGNLSHVGANKYSPSLRVTWVQCSIFYILYWVARSFLNTQDH